MTNALLKSTTRHTRIFTAIEENSNLVNDSDHLTLDLDPDNEFLETDEDKEQNELLNKIKKDLDREEGFMSNSNISGEI